MPTNQEMTQILNAYGVNASALGSSGAFNPWGILISVIFGIMGMYAFNVGRKDKNWRWLSIGVALMAYPYFVPNVILSLVIGCVLTAALYMWRE